MVKIRYKNGVYALLTLLKLDIGSVLEIPFGTTLNLNSEFRFCQGGPPMRMRAQDRDEFGTLLGTIFYSQPPLHDPPESPIAR